MKFKLIIFAMAAMVIIFGCTDDTRVTIINHTDYTAAIEIDTLDYHVNANMAITIIIVPDSVGVEGGPINLKAIVSGYEFYTYTILDPGDNFVWNLFSGEGSVVVTNQTNTVADIKVDTVAYSLGMNQSRTTDIEWFGDLINPQDVSLEATLGEVTLFEYPTLQHGDTYYWNLYSAVSYILVDNQSNYPAQISINGEESWGLSPNHQRTYELEWFRTDYSTIEVLLSAIINYGDDSWEYYEYPELGDGATVKWTLFDNGEHTIEYLP